MYETFFVAYWLGLAAVFAVFSLTGMFGIGTIVRSTLRVRTGLALTVGATAGALLGFVLLGTLPIFLVF
jgi:hypothetical protein